MSNYQAIAMVTSAIQALLQRSLPDGLSDARVTTIRPEKVGNDVTVEPGVNIYLYQVTPNASRRNDDLPTRIEGRVITRPAVALDLYYLISFYGDEASLVPQRLLGAIVSSLHARPFFEKKNLERVAKTRDFLKGVDLTDEIANIRLNPVTMNLEEFSRVWSGFFPSVPYALSVIYKASIVVIEAADVTLAERIPVKEIVIDIGTPAIDRSKLDSNSESEAEESEDAKTSETQPEDAG